MEFIKNNYGFYGRTIAKKIKSYNYTDIEELKKELNKKGEFLLPKINYNSKVTNPTDEKGRNRLLDLSLQGLTEDDRQQIFQISKNIPDPATLIDNVISIQHYRLQKGLEREEEIGLLTEETEVAISNLVTMINAKKQIEEGSEVNINLKNNFQNLIEEAKQDTEINYQ